MSEYKRKAIVSSSTRWILYKTTTYRDLFWNNEITQSAVTHSDFVARASVFIDLVVMSGMLLNICDSIICEIDHSVDYYFVLSLCIITLCETGINLNNITIYNGLC